jgi:hypothetical protein
VIIILPLFVYVALREQKKDRKKERRAVTRFDWRLFLQLSVLTTAVVAVVWYVIEWVLLTPTRANLVERVLAMFSRLSITNPSAVGRSEIWQWFLQLPCHQSRSSIPWEPDRFRQFSLQARL